MEGSPLWQNQKRPGQGVTPGRLRWWNGCSDSVSWALTTRDKKNLFSVNMMLRDHIHSRSGARRMHVPPEITAVCREKIKSSAEIKGECALAFCRGKGLLVSCPLFVLIPVCSLGDLRRHTYQQSVKKKPPDHIIPHQVLCTETFFLNCNHCCFSCISSFEMDLYILVHPWDWLELFTIYKKVQDTQPCKKTENQIGLPTTACFLQ